MALIRLTKQPTESRLYDFDFSGKMVAAATISSVVSVVDTPLGLTIGSPVATDQVVQVRISGGTNQTEYLLTCTITTSTGDTLEMEGRLWVEDVPILSTAEQAALDELVMLTEANTCPTLDYSTATSELWLILNKYQRASIWAANTAYQIGDRVIPTAANRTGSNYIAIAYSSTGTDQKSGATEPSWPATREAQVTDSHVIWREDGFDWNGELWDLTSAAHAGWRLKASKASVTSDVVRGELEIKSSQLFDHCIMMSNRFRPMFWL